MIWSVLVQAFIMASIIRRFSHWSPECQLHPAKKHSSFPPVGTEQPNRNEKLIKELESKEFQVIGNFACKGFDTAGINKLYGGAAKVGRMKRFAGRQKFYPESEVMKGL